MSELSYILNTATERSLVILDEIGRGTSTYDGLSIAWSAAEYLSKPHRKIRTLFATHYHEMTSLEDTIEGIKNLNVDVAEENGDVVFLHKIVPGCASQSYGIHVAKLAGAPDELLERAEEHLENLESGSVQATERTVIKKEKVTAPVCEERQLSFFELAPDPIITKLRDLDLMDTTPSQALRILEELKEYI
jgi:DNA mismatch repair protein MutS